MAQLSQANSLDRSGSPSKLNMNNSKSLTQQVLPYASGTEVNDGSAEVSIFKALGSPSPELFGQGGAKAPYEVKKMPL